MSESKSLDQDALRHRLAEVPLSMRPHIRMGYHLLGKMPRESADAVRDYVVDAMIASKDLDAKQAQEVAGLTEHTIHDVLTALTFSVASIVDLDVDETDFIENIAEDTIEKNDHQIAEQIVKSVIGKRLELKAAMDTDALANAVLPTFRGLSLAVDLRLRMDDDGGVKGVVPVAVARLTTDLDESGMAFQLTARDVERLIERLQKFADKLAAAGNLRFKE